MGVVRYFGPHPQVHTPLYECRVQTIDATPSSTSPHLSPHLFLSIQDGSEVAGVELEGPTGDCDGSLNGQRLFQCRPKHGVFVPADSITAVRLVLQAMSPAKKEAEESFTLHLRLSRRTDKHKRTELLLTAPSHAEMVSWHFALSRAAFHDSPKSVRGANCDETSTYLSIERPEGSG